MGTRRHMPFIPLHAIFNFLQANFLRRTGSCVGFSSGISLMHGENSRSDSSIAVLVVMYHICKVKKLMGMGCKTFGRLTAF